MQFDGFDWDQGNREKCQKHGVSIAEIEEALRVIDFVVDDPFEGEKRYRTVGIARSGKHIFAVFTIRGSRLRPISARYRHAKEIRQYEEELAALKDRRGS